jgi:hypothetical protein
MMSDRRYTLFLVSKPEVNEPWDFELLADRVRQYADEIAPVVVADRRDAIAVPDATLPAMTFSPSPIRFFRPPRGTVFQGRMLSKRQECEALDRCGVPVPRWARLTRDAAPDLSAFGDYVVQKPDRGGRGADVRIVRKERVRWRPPTTDLVRTQVGEDCDWIVQEFVYTGPHPVSYRVASLFGEPLWALRQEADTSRRPLRHRCEFDQGGISIVSSGRGCVFTPVDDPELFAVARRAHGALADVPLVGVDILRDAETGKLFVIELNAIGLTWHLTSPIGRRVQEQFGFDLDTRFDVRRRAAKVLADRVRAHAA